MKNLIVFILLLTTSNGVISQSYHFSQFYSTPLWQNPAFTGYIDGPYRIAANFRSQWVQGGTPYLTGSLSGDFSLFQNKLPEGNNLGTGIAVMNDQSLGGALQNNTLGISLAYNIPLDQDGNQHLGAGWQCTFQQRRIDFSHLTFENQFDLNGYNANLPVGESFTNQKSILMDMNIGLLYNYSMEGKAFFVGISAYNVLQHNRNLEPEQFKQPIRYSLLAGGQVAVGYAGNFYFSLNHLQQGGSHVTTIGGAYGIQIGEEKEQEIDFGIWHRLKDAIIPYLGYKFNGLQFGLSYDYTTSNLQTGSTVRNGYELTFIYRAPDTKELKRLTPWYY